MCSNVSGSPDDAKCNSGCIQDWALYKLNKKHFQYQREISTMYLLPGLSSNRKIGIHHNDGFMISIATQILTEITKDFCFKI